MPKNHWTHTGSILMAAWLLLCGFCGDLPAAANARYSVDHWKAQPGMLPQGSVITMLQTRDGYLWLGTLNGLVRFDGIRFTVFDESNTEGLNTSRIVYLFEDSRKNLWVGTEMAGVMLIKDGQIKSLDIGRGSREGRLVAACEDANGAVWLYTADGHLCRYWEGKIDVWNAGTDSFSGCRALIAEQGGPLWLGTDRGLFGIGPNASLSPIVLPVEQVVPINGKLDFLLASSRGGHWRFVDGHVQKWTASRLERDLGPYPWKTSTTISAACEDQDGNPVVGTLGQGLFRFDTQGKATCISTNEGLSNNYILSLHMDHEGSLWVGTDGGGLNRLKRQVFNLLDESAGLTVQSICEDAQGGLWFSSQGRGVDYWQGGELKQFGTLEGPMNALNLRTMFIDHNQKVWAATFGGGLFQLDNGLFRPATAAEPINKEISAIYEDHAGQIWIGTQTGLACWDGHNWKAFAAADKSSAIAVRALAGDAAGNLWIGTVGAGLSRLKDGQFKEYHKSDGLPSENISSLYVDDDDVLWIGTFGSGLARFDGRKWTSYSVQDGLLSNGVDYLIEDGQGFLWVGSNQGLMRMPKKALNDFARGLTNFIPCRAYGVQDGLPASECTLGSQPAACRTRDGKLWFPTISGMSSVDPAQLHLNTNPPPVVIESILVEGRRQNTNGFRVPVPQSITVPAGKGRIEIQYTSLNLAARDQARFRYRMEGYETDWTDARAATSVIYPKLPPGHYHFQVTACNEDEVWNKVGSSLAIIVLPPFWQKWWFLTLATAMLFGTIIAVVYYLSTQKLQRQVQGLRQQEALEHERSRIARDIHDQLGASLTQVSLLGEMVESDKDSPAEVEAHARQISRTARDTTRALDEIVWTVNPSNDTVEGLVNYICKYSQEYLAVAGLRYRLDVPAQLPDAVISPEVRHNVFLAAKEAVTNVVRHAQASAVRIRLRLDAATFTLEIEDNGRGPAGMEQKAAQSRNGLRNMSKRMEDVGGSFSISPAPEGGTLVRLIVPFKNH